MPPKKKNDDEEKQFRKAFGVEKLREDFNLPAAIYLRDNIHEYIKDKTKAGKALERINKLIQSSAGESHIDVPYSKSKNSDGGGRWFAKNMGSMQSMKRGIRHTICKGILIDLDFVNCHPTLLSQLCKIIRPPIECKFLDMYIDKRDEMIQQMIRAVPDSMNSTKVYDRNWAKKLLCTVLNGGEISHPVRVDWWEQMCTEFADIALKVATHKDYKKVLKHCREDKGETNLHPRTMSSILNNIENECLEDFYGFLSARGCVSSGKCVLAFDGIMIPDTKTIRAKVQEASFLEEASEYIKGKTGYEIKILEKAFNEAFELPEDYADKVQDMIVLDARDDDLAAKEFAKMHKGKLIRCNGRTFWDRGDGIFTDDINGVKDGVSHAVRCMPILFRAKDTIISYAADGKRVDSAVKYVLADRVFEQPGFVDDLFRSSKNYLAFNDGIYSFRTGELLRYPVPGVFFMHKINSNFPTNVDPSVTEEVMDKIIRPSFPDKDEQDYFLYSIARSMAGNVEDKLWHIGSGERNSSKGVVCDLLARCFGDFVQGVTSENLLIKASGGGGDAAKAQSWMSSLEFKRLGMSNEITLQGDRSRVDGNIIKRIASGGDVIEMRTNYKDETRKRLQASFMLNCNDFQPIDPVDACATLEVFEYYSVFQPEHVIIERGDKCPKHWKVSDPTVKTVFVHREDVVDAFTMMVLGAWKPELLKAPASVVENTKLFKGNAAVPEYDRFAQIVKYNPSNTKDAQFLTDEIRLIANNAGLKGMSSQVVNRYVKKLHGHEEFPPVYSEFRKDGKKGWGWSHLRVNAVVAYNFMEERRVENVARNARVNQQVRNGESELGKRNFDEFMDD